MSDSCGNALPLKNITASEIYEELKSKKYIHNLYKDILTRVKETSHYKQMKELAVQRMSENLENEYSLPGSGDREVKKKEITEIGVLALKIDTDMTDILTQSLNKDVVALVENTIKRLASKKYGILASNTSPIKKGIKRNKPTSLHEENVSTDAEVWTKIRSTNTATDDDDNDSIGSESILSVSSVHTSDLSTFDDEIIYYSEDENGVKNEKRLSLKSVNTQAVIQSLSPSKKAKKNDKTPKILASPRPLSVKSVKTNDRISSNTLSKRIRKPNSKYSSYD